MRIVQPSVELMWITAFPNETIEAAGRTCYKSESKITGDSARGFVKKMFSLGHHAMIEHACASMRIITDRGVSHEIVRHRLASYAQESTRYVRYDLECKFIQPPEMNFEAEVAWRTACEYAELSYKKMLDSGASPQIARSVLPTCTATELVMTANFREWWHFVNLRSSKAAHPQIRHIAVMVREILEKYSPEIFKAPESSSESEQKS